MNIFFISLQLSLFFTKNCDMMWKFWPDQVIEADTLESAEVNMKKLIVLLMAIMLVGCSQSAQENLMDTFMSSYGEEVYYARVNNDDSLFEALKGEVVVDDEAKVLCADFDSEYNAYNEVLNKYYEEFKTVLEGIGEETEDSVSGNMIVTFKTKENYRLSIYDSGIVALRIDLNNRKTYKINDETVAKVSELMNGMEEELGTPCWVTPEAEA